jgi:hypothetical protein
MRREEGMRIDTTYSSVAMAIQIPHGLTKYYILLGLHTESVIIIDFWWSLNVFFYSEQKCITGSSFIQVPSQI